MRNVFHLFLFVVCFFQATTLFSMDVELPAEVTLSLDVEEDESKLRRAWILVVEKQRFTPRRPFDIEKPVDLYAPSLPRVASNGFNPVPIPTPPTNFLFVVPIRC